MVRYLKGLAVLLIIELLVPMKKACSPMWVSVNSCIGL